MAGGLRLPRHAHGSGQLVFVLGGSYFERLGNPAACAGGGIRPLPATTGAPRQPIPRCRSAGPGRGLSARAAGGARRLPTAARAAGHGGRPAPGARARARAWRPRRERGVRAALLLQARAARALSRPAGRSGWATRCGSSSAVAPSGSRSRPSPLRSASIAPRSPPPSGATSIARSAMRSARRGSASARLDPALAAPAGRDRRRVRLLRPGPHGAARQARHRRDAGGDSPRRRRRSSPAPLDQPASPR